MYDDAAVLDQVDLKEVQGKPISPIVIDARLGSEQNAAAPTRAGKAQGPPGFPGGPCLRSEPWGYGLPTFEGYQGRFQGLPRRR
ncbi:hypothetical protein ACFVY0_42725 [Streptomyces sp. NPDC058286]|uniref:hypothetical protein n=1 Tax=Streptomyces sp. NPDC058286 TaxID=3346422 RepID=UPI0036E21A6D